MWRNCASVNYAKFFRAPCRKNYTLDRNLDDTFCDGHDELNHHAKFGEDRTTRAGCGCEIVVFVFFCFYRQDAAKRQTAGMVFTHRPKIRFSPRRGDSLHQLRSNFAVPTGTWIRLAVQNFTRIGADGWECGPQNIKNFNFLAKRRPAGATPLTDFQNF